MPNWKKLIVSGSDATLNNLNVTNAVTASYFKGDGSGLSNVTTTIAEIASKPDTFTNTTSKVITHNFGSKDVIVSVFDSTDNLIIPESIVTTNDNNVTITFAENTTGRAVVARGGHIVSGSVTYTQLSNVPGGIISSSKQLPSGIISSSQQLPSNIVSSSVQLSSDISGSFTATSASFATTIAALTSDYTELTNVPGNIVSSSNQLASDISGSVTALSGSIATRFDGLTSDYTALSNIPSGIISSSQQLPSNIVSSSTQVRTAVEAATDSNVFTDADHSKLNAIEASATADQTDAEIRTAVEAASDSNVFTDADHSKLNAIEASATADQTDAEIRAAVEAATDSNVFTDADHSKLNSVVTSGIVSSSLQLSSDISGSFTATSASFATTIGSLTSDYTELTNIPGGIISSSTFNQNISITKTDPTLTFYDNSGANSDPNGKIVFSEANNANNFEISYNGTQDRLEFIGLISSTLTDLVYINRNATTPLNVIGGATFAGDVTVTGTVNAAEINTTYVSSSVIYNSGSNIFGDEASDQHQFTGSIDLTGPVTASAIQLVDSNTKLTQYNSDGQLQIDTQHGYLRLGPGNGSYSHVTTDRGKFYFNKRVIVDEGTISSYNEDLQLQSPEGSTRLTLDKDTGHATFSSAVSASAFTGSFVGALSGNASTATAAVYSTYTDILTAVDDRDMKPNTSGVGSTVKGVKPFFTSLGGMTGTADADWQDVLVLDTYSDTSGGSANALSFDKSTQLIRHWQAGQTATSWGTSKTLAYTDSNISGFNNDSNYLTSLTLSSGIISSSQQLPSNIVSSSTQVRTAVEAASDSNVFTDADHSKLNAIEASATADQTDAEIRTAVEAATDSNVFTDADHSKLNGIEASATADQSASEILTAIKTVDGTGSGLDADKLDGIDSTDFYRQIAENTATVGPGWMTVALSSGARGHADIIVSDGDSGDHAFVQVNWLRSYADSSFTVLNTGGHQNRITGVRVIQDSSDVTYGNKYLQVYVSVSSAYYTRINKFGNPGAYTTDFTAPTPVIENTKTGYAVKGTSLESLSDYNFGAEQGVETNKLKVLDESILTGDVGIGTSSPNTKLQVGDGSVDDAARVYFSDGTFTEMRGYGLQFSRAQAYIRPTADGTKNMAIGTSGATWNILAFDANSYNFQKDEVSRLYIGTNGNVGIGTITPGSALDVVGHISASGAISASAYIGDGSALTGVVANVTQEVTVTDTFSSVTSNVTTHNFGTKNVIVSVYDSNDQVIIPASITTTNVNVVTVTFATATSGRVVVAKGGHIVSGSMAVDIVEETTVLDTFTSSTSKAVTHNFGTKNVLVSVYDNTDKMIIPQEVVTTDVNTVTITLATATTGRVIVAKGGHLVSGSSEATVDFGAVGSHILPSTTEIYDLGSSSKRWRDIYLSGSTIDLGGTKITRDGDGDIEFKDSNNNLKKVRAAEMVLGTGGSQKRMKLVGGKVVTTDTSGNVEHPATASYALTASFVEDSFISASAVRSGFGAGGTDISALSITGSGFTNVSTVAVNHGFGTKEVVVSVYDNGDNLIMPSNIKTTTTGSVDITFAQPRTGRVVVSKGGHVVTSVTGFNAATAEALTAAGSRQGIVSVTTAVTASLFSTHLLRGHISMSLPSAVAGDWVKVSNRITSSYAHLVPGGAQKIMGSTDSLQIDSDNAGFELIYADSTDGWVIIGQ
jgi:drug/metabolite transporter superfamily protein YnfA